MQGSRSSRNYRLKDWGILARDFDSLWSDARQRSILMNLLARAEEIEEVNGASAHHISVGVKR